MCVSGCVCALSAGCSAGGRATRGLIRQHRPHRDGPGPLTVDPPLQAHVKEHMQVHRGGGGRAKSCACGPAYPCVWEFLSQSLHPGENQNPALLNSL